MTLKPFSRVKLMVHMYKLSFKIDYFTYIFMEIGRRQEKSHFGIAIEKYNTR